MNNSTPPPTLSSSLRFLHIGDLHFWAVPGNPLAYLSKRCLGVGNLLIGGRARRFRIDQAPTLVQRIVELCPDGLLFSGDFSTTALAQEFKAAATAMAPALEGLTAGAFSVPGNHDCYLPSEVGGSAFATGLGESFRPERSISVTTVNPKVTLIRVNAGTRNGLGSHGKVEKKHLEVIRGALASKQSDDLILFLCHFPAEDPPKGFLRHDRGPQLRGSELLLDVFSQCRSRILWLHGHHHYRYVLGSRICNRLTYLNAGAPLMRIGGRPPDLGFHEITLGESGEFALRTHWRYHGGCEWKEKPVVLPGQGECFDLQQLE